MKRKIAIVLSTILVISLLCASAIALSGCTADRKLDKAVNKLINYKLDIDDATAIGLGRTGSDQHNYLIKATKNSVDASSKSSKLSLCNDIVADSNTDALIDTALEKITLTKTKNIKIGDKEIEITQDDIPAKILKMKIAGDFLFMQLVPKDTPDDAFKAIDKNSDFAYGSREFYSGKTTYKSTTIIASIKNGQIYKFPDTLTFSDSQESFYTISCIQNDGLIYCKDFNGGQIFSRDAIALSVNANDELIFRKVITNKDIDCYNIQKDKNDTLFVSSNANGVLDNIVYVDGKVFPTSNGMMVKTNKNVDNFFINNTPVSSLHFEVWENDTWRELNANDNFVIKNHCGGYLLTVKNGELFQSLKLSIDGNKLYCKNWNEEESKVVYEGKSALNFTYHGINGYTANAVDQNALIFNCQCNYIISELSPTGTIEYKVTYDDEGNFDKLETTRSTEYNGYSFVAIQPIK